MSTPAITEVVLSDAPTPVITAPAAGQVAAPGVVETGASPVNTAKKPRRKVPGTKVPRAAQLAAGIKAKRGAGTKLQTQVPKEWRAEIIKRANKYGIRESDVIREFIRRGLGIGKTKARALGIQA